MSTQPLNRRTVVRGLGTVLALPWLESMSSGKLYAAAKTPPKRIAFIYTPNGAIMPTWTPEGEGRDYKLSKTLQPLQSMKDHFQVITGLAHQKANANGDGGGDHARANATFLTASQARKTAGADIKLGISVDQIAAQELGSLTRLPSLELGCDRPRGAGRCDSGYSCAYVYNLSWKSETVPLPPEHDPKLAFERIFGTNDSDASKRQAISKEYDKSLLDFVLADTQSLSSKLGYTDRQKLDQYLSSIREIEQRIERSKKFSQQFPDFKKPTGIPGDYKEHLRLMFDMLVLAFQTDSTRISTFLQAHDGSNRSFKSVGVSQGHHSLSHHQNNADKIAQIEKIDLFYIQNFAEFLGKMQSIQEGDGTLLDNCAIVYGSGISDANRHRHNNLPVILAGGKNQGYKPGRHFVLPVEENTPMANLYLTMLERFGVQADKLGDSTGYLPVV
jgi:hypothetical protein